MTRKKAGREDGQAGLEGLILLALLVVIIKGFVMLFWLLSGRLWLNHQLYQHLVCRVRGHSEMLCRKRLLTETDGFIPEGRITNIKSSFTNNTWQGSLHWKAYGLSVPVKQKVSLP